LSFNGKREAGNALKRRIGVMGPGSCAPEIYELAYRVGFGIACKGAILICGGRGGVMEAAAKGAREAGGLTIGILPGPDASEANPYIEIPIVTDLGNARNVINVLTSESIIAIDGAYGTLSEIALALKCGTPVVGLHTWNPAAPGDKPLPITLVATPEEAVDAALAMAGARGRKD
jgi:uncharacterized protein (TIGR00725 family)